MSFSTRLKELRLKNNLSQENLARKIDILRGTYIFYETGKKYPPVEVLIRIAKFFNVSISFLLDEQENFDAKKLVGKISDLFKGNELSETEKDALMEALQEAYLATKKNE